MAEPTPGPWEANCFLITAANGRQVALYGLLGRRHSSFKTQSGGEEDEANAHLMAASPDLLAACKLARAFGSQGDTPEGLSVSEILRAAIAKAKGQPAPVAR